MSKKVSTRRAIIAAALRDATGADEVRVGKRHVVITKDGTNVRYALPSVLQPGNKIVPGAYALLAVKNAADAAGGLKALADQVGAVEKMASRVGSVGRLRSCLDALTAFASN